MVVYPAVDIRNGKCVRLTQGRYDEMTVFGDDPVEMALRWQSAGARYLHVVDLDGARTGGSNNRELIGKIIKALRIPVQTGGGIRTMADIEEVLGMGAGRVILGTTAVNNPSLVAEAVGRFGEKIVAGIDAKGGMVAIDGWEKTSRYASVEFALKMEALGVKTIIYTDIATDGMLTGPNMKAMEEMKNAVKMDVIASGGVGSVEDLLNLRRVGVAGAITGKAIYSGAIDLSKAISAVENQ